MEPVIGDVVKASFSRNSTNVFRASITNCLSPKEYVRECLQATWIQRAARSDKKQVQTISSPLRRKRSRANVAVRSPGHPPWRDHA